MTVFASYVQSLQVWTNPGKPFLRFCRCRSEFLKKAAQNRAASNELREEVINKLRTSERLANVEHETRNLAVYRAVDRTPYWKNESISKAIKSTFISCFKRKTNPVSRKTGHCTDWLWSLPSKKFLSPVRWWLFDGDAKIRHSDRINPRKPKFCDCFRERPSPKLIP